MKHKSNKMIINYNNLPEAVGLLLQRVDRLSVNVMDFCNAEKREEKPEYMNTKDLIEYVAKEWGAPMSKSKLYKKTAKGLIPYRKVGKNLVFSRREIDEWLEQSMTSPDEIRTSAVNAVVKSAQLKERRAK